MTIIHYIILLIAIFAFLLCTVYIFLSTVFKFLNRAAAQNHELVQSSLDSNRRAVAAMQDIATHAAQTQTESAEAIKRIVTQIEILNQTNTQDHLEIVTALQQYRNDHPDP